MNVRELRMPAHAADNESSPSCKASGLSQDKSEDTPTATITTETAADKPNDSKTDLWLAPLEPEEETVPGSFLIKFRPGHSMEQHFAYIGRELYGQPHRASGDHRGYAVSAVLDQELLLKIRRDPGVAHVYPAVPAFEDYEDEDEDVLM
ncbi:unnamed protein product [Cercospora beticola]|nr:unnamed protein product [Cercospora beticola]